MPRPSEQELRSGLSAMLNGWEEMSLEEYAGVSAAIREQAKKKGWALSDGSYPIMNAGMLKAAATLAASGHGNVTAALALIRKRAKELGVKLASLPGLGTEKSADSSDGKILAGIKALISLQEGDEDSPSDAKVMSALRSALAAQEADMREEA